MKPSSIHPLSSILYPLFGIALLTGCDTRDPDMYYQPRHDPYEASTFFADGNF